jgi:hypothetical protein
MANLLVGEDSSAIQNSYLLDKVAEYKRGYAAKAGGSMLSSVILILLGGFML